MHVGASVIRAIVDGYAEHNDRSARDAVHAVVDPALLDVTDPPQLS
jgi:hypothetical protein